MSEQINPAEAEAKRQAEAENAQKVLVMISTHGTWSTTDQNKADLLREYYDKACEAVMKKLKDKHLEGFQLYLGYDGDGVQSVLVPPTLLLLMLIDKFAEYNPIIIQSQALNSDSEKPNWYGPQPFTDIVNRMNNTNLEPYEKAFVNQLNIQNVNKFLSQDKNITLAYKEKENNYTHWYEIEPANDKKAESFSEYFKNENVYIPIDLTGIEGANKGKYGGHNDGTLVGSTAAWQKYFDENDPSFDHVYYLPVWNDYFTQINEKKDKDEITEIKHNLWDTPEEEPEKPIIYKKYKEFEDVNVNISGNPVTKLIQEACNNKIFTNDEKRIEVIEGCVKKLIVEKISNVQLLIKQFNTRASAQQGGGRRTKKGENKKSKKVNRKNTRKTLKNKRKSTKKRMYKRK